MRKFIDLVTENQNLLVESRHLTPSLKKQRDRVSKALKREHPDWPEGKVYAIATSAAEKTVKEDASGLDEATLSAKAGRAGRDLGKPGKNFKKIEKKAAEEYGSEKAGERVAGAILANMRKHVKEAFVEAGIDTVDEAFNLSRLIKPSPRIVHPLGSKVRDTSTIPNREGRVIGHYDFGTSQLGHNVKFHKGITKMCNGCDLEKVE